MKALKAIAVVLLLGLAACGSDDEINITPQEEVKKADIKAPKSDGEDMVPKGPGGKGGG